MPWTTFDTELGTCGLAWSDRGLTWLQLPEKTVAETRARLLSKSNETGPPAKKPPPWIAETIARTRAHLAGNAADFASVPLDVSTLTPFITNVYRELQKVPIGKTVTYGELARRVGSKSSARAIGRAMATNPYPIVVPCHRVLAAGQSPGGFSAWGGVITKERILALEGVRLQTSEPLFKATNEVPLPYDRVEARRHLASSDALLATHLERVGDFTLSLKQTEGTFAALAESIVYQQLSGKAAGTIFGRVRALFPRERLDPAVLLAMSDEKLRAAGLSAGKLAALRDLAERAAAGSIPTLSQLAKMEDEAIVECLTEVRGIGRWTVEMLLIFRLGRPDVFPVADYGIRKGFAQVFHRGKRKQELPDEMAMIRRAERWRPYRSVASWYLWRALDP